MGDSTVSCCIDGRWHSIACTGKAQAVKLDQGPPFRSGLWFGFAKYVKYEDYYDVPD